jgi:predicted O-methyltransferase YrrM
MDVASRTRIYADGATGAARLAIDGFRLTAAERVAALVAQVRYPPKRFEHYAPRWAGLTGWLSPRQGARLFDLARSTAAAGDIVEIGSAFGRSTVALGLGTRARGHGRVYAVDPHTGGIGLAEQYGPLALTFSSLGAFLQNIVRFGLQEVVVPVTLPSRDAAAIWPGTPIRLLFIDGWHDYDASRADILTWSRWISPGGVLVVHDYDWPEVRRALDDCRPQLAGFGEADHKDPNMAVLRREAAP